jgi:predicted Mrr-cat superfamily restriction endonuclease
LTLFTISPEVLQDLQRAASSPQLDSPNAGIENEKNESEQIRQDTVERAHELIKDRILELDEYEMQDLVAAILRAM